MADLGGVQKLINTEKVSKLNMFGTREFLKNNYLYRFAGAELGLYGNSGDEAVYLAYFVDANNQPCDASKTGYSLSFPKGELPPAKAFGRLYDARGRARFRSQPVEKRYL